MARSNRLRAAVAFTAVVPVAILVACNLITGVNEFQSACAEDCGTPPFMGMEAGVDADASDAHASDSGDVGGMPESGGTDDASDASEAGDAPPAPTDAEAGPTPNELWSYWPMPNPHDAGVDANLSSYTPGSGIVTDNVTKLVWEGGAPATLYTMGGALAYCAALAPAGSWRLPTRIELASLVDWTMSPAIDGIAFPDAGGGPFWTSSAVAFTDGGAFWNVDFDDGTVTSKTLPALRRVRCVEVTKW